MAFTVTTLRAGAPRDEGSWMNGGGAGWAVRNSCHDGDRRLFFGHPMKFLPARVLAPVLFLASALGALAQAPRPNVIFIMADDLGGTGNSVPTARN